MSFLFERVPDADKQRLNLCEIKIGWTKADPMWWAFDREIDAFLVRIVQDREPPHAHWYVFRWKEKTVELSVLVEDGPPILSDDTPTIFATARWMPSSPFSTELEDEKSFMTIKIIEALHVCLQGERDRAPWGTVVTSVSLQKY